MISGKISSLKQNNRDDLVVTDKDRLNILKSIGGNTRSKEEEKEYKKLMERKRKADNVGGQNKKFGFQVEDHKHLEALRSLGGKGRSKEQEQEYKKLMERKRQHDKKSNSNAITSDEVNKHKQLIKGNVT